jgi:cytochrome P450
MCAMLAIAGYETTTNLICHALLQLNRHPEQRAWLNENLDGIPNAIKETVRYCSPTTLVHRVVTRDVELHGCTIPRGAPVGLILAAASRDERHYPDPDRFDVRRVDAESLGFGQGRHACFGAPLARLEARIVLEEMLRRFPNYEIDTDSVKRSQPGPTIGFERMLATF